MRDAIGAMRARVALQAPSRVADEIGGAAIAWTAQGEVWAAIEAAGAGESAAFDTIGVASAWRLSINRRDDIRPGWRVLWGARRLRITGVVDEGAPRVVLLCEEIAP